MKTIKILHLYYDLLNLYGENGNIRYLEYKLKEQDVNVIIDKLSLNDDINFKDYDVVYVGTGTEDNLLKANKDILRYKDDIKDSINNTTYIVTGNASCLFGKEIKYLDDKLDALDILDFNSFEVEERIVGEQRYSTKLIDYDVIGFQNRNFILDINDEEPFFTVLDGNSSNNSKDNKNEGIICNNIYLTVTIGPLLVRNPYLTDYIIKELCDSKKVTYKEPNIDHVSYKAYDMYLNNFYNNEKSSN